MWKIAASTLASVTLAAGASGCGGVLSGWDLFGGSTTPPLSKPKFVATANKFCSADLLRVERRALKVFEGKSQLYLRNGDLNEFAGSLKRQEIAIVLAPGLRKRAEKIRALGIPRGEERGVEKALRAIEAAAKGAEGNPFGFLTESVLKRPARRLARADGIENCAIMYRRGGLYEKGTANPVGP